MKQQKSKKAQRSELAQLVQDFVKSGGEVVNVPSGTSGNTQNQNLFRQRGEVEPKSERTPLTDVVKTLEERKSSKNDQKNTSTQRRRPKKRLIVDDFGDPVRWVWEE